MGRVRELRAQETEAEVLLWEQLRGRRFLGLKFRRQFPVEGFIADFCCYEQKLIVELDGDVHLDPSQVARDENRDSLLRSLGYKILRFPNQRIFEAMSNVLREIADATTERYRVDR